MKRLFLIASMISLLVCLLATPSLAIDLEDMPAYDRAYNVEGIEYPIWEQDAGGNYHPLIWYLNSENKMCKVWADNQDTTKLPYVTYACYITDSDAEIGTIRIYDENGTEYKTRDVAVIANLNNVQITYQGKTSYIKRVNQNAFQGSSAVKAVFLPKTIDYIGPNVNDQYKFASFRECTNLEYVEFPANSAIKTIGNGAFYKCSSLKAISLPNNITVIEPVAFQHCTSLQAVYLPDGFQKMMCNDATSGSFNNCTSMYFVDEPFVLNSTLSNIPEKKSVYYFPSTLTGMGEGIRNCANMNETLVIPNYTSHTTSTYEGTGVKTVIYLGEMTYFWMTATQNTRVNIVFANTTSTPTIEVTGDHSAGTTIYLCKLDKYYNLNDKKWSEGTTHFEEASKTIIIPSVSCTEPSKKTTTCFCGVTIGTFDVEGSSESSHNFDLSNGATLVGITYSSFGENGFKTIACGNCPEQSSEFITPSLFTCLGYSSPEYNSSGISISFLVNHTAIDEYEVFNKTSLSYGIFAVSEYYAEDKDIINSDGTAIAGVASVDFSKHNYDIFAIKVVGFETEAHKNAKLALGAYVIENSNVMYLQESKPTGNNSYCYISYNDFFNNN